MPAMYPPDNCPACGTSLLGYPIPEDQQQYFGGKGNFRREIGVNVQGAYDGVLYWQCPDCGHKFHRFDKTSRERWIAERYMNPEEKS